MHQPVVAFFVVERSIVSFIAGLQLRDRLHNVHAGVLIGGRLLEVFIYEWPYYIQHLSQIAAAWLGGMSTHGVLLGVVVAASLFCRLHEIRIFALGDELVIPGSYLMGMGRIGNFIDGQIVGSVTDVWWAVQFPDAPGFRHPVVLYDGAKNFLILGLLLWLRRSKPATALRNCVSGTAPALIDFSITQDWLIRFLSFTLSQRRPRRRRRRRSP